MNNGCNKDFQMDEAGKNTRAYLGLKIKTQGQEQYPDGPPAEFEVCIVKKGSDAKEYGLEIDSQDNKYLQVYKVDPGAFQKYNETADPSKQVMTSDFIVAVNSKTGSAADLMAEFTGEEVTVKIVRAIELAVIIENDKKNNHGLTFPTMMKNHVLVVMNIGDGCIQDYNNKCTQESQKIRPYDRIVSIKGQVGKAAKLKTLLDGTTGTFQLGIQRMVPAEAIQTMGKSGNASYW